MPRWLKATVYLLLVLTFIHEYLKPTILEGQLWIEDATGHRHPGKNYIIESGRTQFLTNANGKWVLQSTRRIPGTIVATVTDPQDTWIGQVDLMLPIPIYSSAVEQSYSITYKEGGLNGGQLIASNDWNLNLVSSAYADDDLAPKPVAPALRKDLVISIRDLDVKESGDHNDPVGNVYTQVYLNGKRIRTPKLPQKDFPNSYLSLQDNSKNAFDSLLFAIPTPTQSAAQRLEIRLYESDFFGHDDLIGVFKADVKPEDVGKTILMKSGKLARNWPDNASMAVDVGSVERPVVQAARRR